MSLTPLNDYVLIKRTEASKMSAGGIALPDEAQTKQNTGTVVAVGETADNITEGDIVLFGNYAGSEITLEGKTILIMKSDELIAKVG